MTWSDVAVAGAFVAGIVAGGVGVIRVFRYVLEYVRSTPPDGGPPEPSGGVKH